MEEERLNIINMRQMKVNQSGRISSIKVAGELGRRIRDMELTQGTEVIIKGRAPLNDPVALRVRGFTLSLRNSEANHYRCGGQLTMGKPLEQIVGCLGGKSKFREDDIIQ